MKRKRMELEMERVCENDRFAAEERVLSLKQQMQKEELVLKHQMQEKELAYRERALQMEIELAQLKGVQASVSSDAHHVGLAQEYHLTNAYPSADQFTFPPLPSTGWDLPAPSLLES